MNALLLLLPMLALTDPLVDADWLKERLEQVVVLDIRSETFKGGTLEEYLDGHVPGAVYTDYDHEAWSVKRAGVPGLRPPQELLTRLIGSLGIGNSDHVVVVAAGKTALDMGTAVRAYWLFKMLGHEKVSVLDGGLNAWKRADYALEKGWQRRRPVVFEGRYGTAFVADKNAVRGAVKKGIPLIDTRPEAFYRGEKKHAFSACCGTLPGAVNIPYESLFVNGAVVKAGAARALWKRAGVPLEGEQIIFCTTGHCGSLAWFVAHEILGNHQVKLYDGSWAEWSRDADAPKEMKD
jgi:thiosulfate/3-mercaptopyruvate sulfurtransferase